MATNDARVHCNTGSVWSTARDALGFARSRVLSTNLICGKSTSRARIQARNRTLPSRREHHTMPGPTPHRTPLRRVSQGSLFALSRSGAHTDAPHGLGFIEPALAELADEAEALRANVDGLRALSASLDTFNESFASWLYVMDMNALTVEWPEVRAPNSIHRASFFFFSFFVSTLS